MANLTTRPINQPPPPRNEALEELRALRRELQALRQLFDSFAGSYLNARFPYGKSTDRWGRR